MWIQTDSNCRDLDLQSSALPTELQIHYGDFMANLRAPGFILWCLQQCDTPPESLWRGWDSNPRYMAYETKLEPTPVHPACIIVL